MDLASLGVIGAGLCDATAADACDTTGDDAATLGDDVGSGVDEVSIVMLDVHVVHQDAYGVPSLLLRGSAHCKLVKSPRRCAADTAMPTNRRSGRSSP